MLGTDQVEGFSVWRKPETVEMKQSLCVPDVPAPQAPDAAAELSRRYHPACLVCSNSRPDSLGLRFEQHDDGSVCAVFNCGAAFQGYPDRLHGGVVALLLDAAMTHCLFAAGVAGVTARTEVKFRHPVAIDAPVQARARIVRTSPPSYQLKAELLQGGQIKATSIGFFVDHPRLVQGSRQCRNAAHR